MWYNQAVLKPSFKNETEQNQIPKNIVHMALMLHTNHSWQKEEDDMSPA